MKYDVTIHALAFVRQKGIQVKAESSEEAKQIALDNMNNGIWEYEGIRDDTVEVDVHTAK